ncbi:MAG: hypothetical protein HY930_05955 [Euryarchaeota archaeon]|nr:hypothetical protein [Euryarchaeota archaeon]
MGGEDSEAETKKTEAPKKIPDFMEACHGALNKKLGGRGKGKLVILASLVIFLLFSIFHAFVSGLIYQTFFKKGEAGTGSIGKEEVSTAELYSLVTGRTVSVGGEEIPAGIYLRSRIDGKAPKKGWLIMETPFYKIELNLDHPHYMLFDKLNQRQLTIYNISKGSKIEMLTGASMGFADLDGENAVSFSHLAVHDESGLSYRIAHEDRQRGFLLIATEGWDFWSTEVRRGYDIEGEVMLGLFADKPYFIDAFELNNLQKLGYTTPLKFRSPTEIVKDWVIAGDYDSAVIKGGDPEHPNRIVYEDYYSVTTIGHLRKPWHAGSAEISKMFPDHVLIGNRMSGGVIFSLPKGKFRFDDSLGANGAQVVSEFLISLDTPDSPEKATVFSIDVVNREAFLYDAKEYVTVKGYPESVKAVCRKYSLACPDGVLDARDWKTKRAAYAITMVKDWYNKVENQPNKEIWALADEALKDFSNYEEIVWRQMEATKPLLSQVVVR